MQKSNLELQNIFDRPNATKADLYLGLQAVESWVDQWANNWEPGANKTKILISRKTYLKYVYLYRKLPNVELIDDCEANENWVKSFVEQFDSDLKVATNYRKRIVKIMGPETTFLDGSHTVNFSLMSGVQRVVKKLVTFLGDKKNILLVRFDTDSSNYIKLDKDFFFRTPVEGKGGFSLKSFIIRVLRIILPYFVRYFLGRTKRSLMRFLNEQKQESFTYLPIGSTYLLAEVVGIAPRIPYLNCLVGLFGLRINAIFYDLIPILHPELCSISDEFIRYLHLIKITKKISCISNSAKMDLEKFLDVLDVKPGSIDIGYEYLGFDHRPIVKAPESPIKTILCIGSIDPRKNQIRVAQAAVLLAQKHKFNLVLAGNFGFEHKDIIPRLQNLKDRGAPVKIVSGPSDREMETLIGQCHFSVFCSLAEGFGLPILESLAYKKPVVVSNFGSMKEIADIVGGCIYADPRSPQSIADAMEKLLVDTKTYDKLVSEINFSQWPSWEQYANKIYQNCQPKPVVENPEFHLHPNAQ